MANFRNETIDDIAVERNINRNEAVEFLIRAEKRGSGFATGNLSFPIQYTTRQTRNYVAKRLNEARTIHHKMNKGFKIKSPGWGSQYFKGLVCGMSDMLDAVVNNDVEV